MKNKIQRWLAITLLDARLYSIEKDRRVEELDKEVRLCMKYIGALYDYLEVRPQRTFVQDYSRLPEERFPTMEVIKVEPAKKMKK